MASSDSLPPGWAELTADDGRKYYHHEENGVTQWERPDPPADDAGAQDDTRPLPPGWAELTSPDGRPYFFHEEQQITQWERPSTPVDHKGEGSALTLPDGWEELATEDGRTYYFHKVNNVTQWERPGSGEAHGAADPLPNGWEQLVTDDGRTYYHNPNVGITQWERPEPESATEASTTASADEPVTAEADASSRPASDQAPESEAHEKQQGASSAGTADTKAGPSSSASSASSSSEPVAVAPTEPLSPPSSTSDWSPRAAAKLKPLGGGLEGEQEVLQESEEEALAFFEDIDVERTGFVTARNMGVYAKEAGLGLSKEHIAQAIAAQDIDGDGRISLREYLVSQGKALPVASEWFIRHIFDRFASSPDGISPIELRKALQTLEVEHSDDDLRHWMRHPLSIRSVGMRRLPFPAFLHIFIPERFNA